MAKGQTHDAQGNEREVAEGETNGTPWRHLGPWDPTKARYPQGEGTHTWNAWPILAIETGGYSDYEVHHPYTGEVFWARAWDENPYTGLRKLVDAMEAAGFLDAPDETGEPAKG